MNPYEVSGLWRDASPEEIEQRYVLLRERLADERRENPSGVAKRSQT
jgi:hypothetical protein